MLIKVTVGRAKGLGVLSSACSASPLRTGETTGPHMGILLTAGVPAPYSQVGPAWRLPGFSLGTGALHALLASGRVRPFGQEVT